MNARTPGTTWRPAFRAALATVLATQAACVGELHEHCPLLTDHRSAPALPRDFIQLDDLLRHRALQMWHDARQLNGSATRSFRIYFGEETLPLVCARMEQARALAAAGRVDAAGRKYQALLVLSQLIELAIAMHATVEYADQVKELSLTLSRTQETFGNQMKPLLEAALSEDPRRIEQALRESAPAMSAWLEHLQRWAAHIQADAKRMVVAKAVWDITIGVIAAHETAGALAEVVAGGGPPVLPAPALGGVAAMELSGAAYVELAEAIRRLIAAGALDAAVVAALSGKASMAVQAEEGAVDRPAPVKVGEWTLDPSVARHLADVSKSGELVRPYLTSPQTLREIMTAREPVPDPRGYPGAVRYDVPGTFRGSKGIWELVVHPATKTVLHWVFKSAP